MRAPIQAIYTEVEGVRKAWSEYTKRSDGMSDLLTIEQAMLIVSEMRRRVEHTERQTPRYRV